MNALYLNAPFYVLQYSHGMGFSVTKSSSHSYNGAFTAMG